MPPRERPGRERRPEARAEDEGDVRAGRLAERVGDEVCRGPSRARGSRGCRAARRGSRSGRRASRRAVAIHAFSSRASAGSGATEPSTGCAATRAAILPPALLEDELDDGAEVPARRGDRASADPPNDRDRLRLLLGQDGVQPGDLEEEPPVHLEPRLRQRDDGVGPLASERRGLARGRLDEVRLDDAPLLRRRPEVVREADETDGRALRPGGASASGGRRTASLRGRRGSR